MTESEQQLPQADLKLSEKANQKPNDDDDDDDDLQRLIERWEQFGDESICC